VTAARPRPFEEVRLKIDLVRLVSDKIAGSVGRRSCEIGCHNAQDEQQQAYSASQPSWFSGGAPENEYSGYDRED
jgi:hypothetical protein